MNTAKEAARLRWKRSGYRRYCFEGYVPVRVHAQVTSGHALDLKTVIWLSIGGCRLARADFTYRHRPRRRGATEIRIMP